jgi:hypothetical protein
MRGWSGWETHAKPKRAISPSAQFWHGENIMITSIEQKFPGYLFQRVILGKSRWRSLVNAICIWYGYKPKF